MPMELLVTSASAKTIRRGSGSGLLRAYLKTRGIRVTTFANELGCSPQLVRQWIGGSTPSLNYAVLVEDKTQGAVPARSWAVVGWKPTPPSRSTATDAE